MSALAKQDAIRREGYFYKVFLVVMFSSVLPLILLLALFLPLSTQQITAELEATYINSMNAINSSVNMVFNQIVEDCLLISRDTTFAEYIKIPSAQVRQLESAPARYTDAVMDNLGKYIRIKGKLYSNLSTMKFMMPFVDSVYFLDVGKQLILTSNNKFSPVQNFSDQDFINRLRDYSAIKYISPIRRCVHPDGSVIDVITVFINSVFQHDGGVFAMNIDSAKLADYLFGDFDGSSGYMLIMSEAGVASDMRNFPEQVAAMLSDTDLIQKLSDLEDRASLFERGYLFVKNASTNKHWFYLSMLDVDQVFSASIRLRNILLVIFGGLFTLSLLLAVFSSNRLYHPIRLLRKMLTGYVQLPEEKDVFRSLGAYVALSENEKQDMKSQIHTLTPYYRENILLFLLYRNAVSAEPIDNRKQFSEWGFQQGGLALLMFGISFTQDALSVVQPPISVAIKQYLVLKLEMALSRTGIAAQDISGRFFLLCNVSSDDYRRMYDFAKSIADEFFSELHFACNIGISSYFADLSELPEARREAQEALGSAVLSKKEPVCFFSDIEIARKGRCNISHDYIQKIVENIKAGNAYGAKELWDQMLEALRAMGGNKVSGQVRVGLLGLCSEIFRIVWESNGEPSEICRPLDTAYKKLLDGNEYELINQIDSIIDKLCAFFASNAAMYNARKMDMIMGIIEEQYAKDLSLADIAEMVGMNPDYLGRILKERTGSTFVECLTRVRIEKSKALLRNPDMRVKDIGPAVGYYNSNYYIRVFKGETGMTPLEYRKHILE